MAEMIDSMPTEYKGEEMVFQSINELPNDIVCYNHREVMGKEFDFCLLIKDIGILIIEVKGWSKRHIVGVDNPDSIRLSDGSVSKSPKKQARMYAFNLQTVLENNYGIEPLLMNMVCYPFLYETDYYRLGLNCVSEPTFTLFKEDISSPEKMTRKIIGVYQKTKYTNHDRMDERIYNITRRHFEPSYINHPPVQNQIPYSCLSVFTYDLSLKVINELIHSYFAGTKQIVFVKDKSELELIVYQLSQLFIQRNIAIDKGDLVLNLSSNEATFSAENDRFAMFNFEVFCYGGKVDGIVSFNAYNGQLSAEQETTVERLAAVTAFNINQFQVEHAETGRDIQVRAGAGTGKTYSMVSRIAYLCSSASNSGIMDPSSEIAMLTFTADAALNMKSRIKRMFMNYFILTGKTRYLDAVTNIEKMRISTIHSFAGEIISNTSTVLGVGTEFNTVSGKYEKQKIFDRLFAEFLEKENCDSPLFFNRLPMSIETFRKNLLEIAGKLYEKGCDIKTVSKDTWGIPPEQIPYMNRIFETVVIETEKEYSQFLVDNNSVALSEYMLHLSKCIADKDFNNHVFRFKYIFIDEFQDTDDAQISAFVSMQRKLGFNFFIVGDLKQSIYRFRGATMTAFEKMGCNSGKWLSFTLNINYRSDKRLLEKYGESFLRMGQEGLLTYRVDADVLTGVRAGSMGDNDLITYYSYNTADRTQNGSYYDKLFEVVEQQRQRINSEMIGAKLSRQERTIAILTRKNQQIKDILRVAKEKGVAIESDNHSDLYRLASSTDLCRLTAALCNPYNPTYLYDLIHSRNVNIEFDVRAVMGKTNKEKADVFIECLDQFYGMTLGKTWHELIKDTQSEPILKTLRLIYEATKPWKSFSPDESRQKYYRANYEQLFEELSRMNKRNFLTLDYINETLHINILTGSEARSREIKDDSDDVRVVCLTVHKSKGLEYGTVILARTDDEIDQLSRAGIEVTYIDGKIGYCMTHKGETFSNQYYPKESEIQENMMEESRILYVAMTRAINNFIWFNDINAKGYCWGSILKEM